MSIEQIIVLAVVQGITEFLPISSSGHLILVPQLMHWKDQGIVVDVMTHLGTLLAVLIYFWRDVWRLIRARSSCSKARSPTTGGSPSISCSPPFRPLPSASFSRSWAMPISSETWPSSPGIPIIYGILMMIADMVGPQERTIANMTLSSALIIGVAQALALIPGTSRSGVTMTAARFLGFTRPDAARFSFLLAIPAMSVNHPTGDHERPPGRRPPNVIDGESTNPGGRSRRRGPVASRTLFARPGPAIVPVGSPARGRSRDPGQA